MTGPLVVLALGSIFAGVLNLPHVLPNPGWLEHWLEPVTELSHRYWNEVHLAASTEWLLMGLATAIAVAGMAGAVIILKPEKLKAAKEAPAETGMQKVLLKKWYVDEIYDALIVRPTVWMSRNVLWKFFDAGVIDGAMVNGSAWTARAVGFVGSAVQTGRLAWYLLVFVIGTLVLLRAVM
jgi:NADH-quinone oxidoreductase subunit L